MIARTNVLSHLPLSLIGMFSGPRRAAAVASAVWILVVITYAVGFLTVSVSTQTRGTVFLDAMFFLVALVLPILLVWIAARLAEELQLQKEVVLALAELTTPLSAELSATRQALATVDPQVSTDLQNTVAANQAREIADIASRVSRLQASIDRIARELQTPQSNNPRPPAPGDEPEAEAPRGAPSKIEAPNPGTKPAPDQPDLPLRTTNVSERPEWNELVRALDFPKDDQDFEGFRALQSVLKYPPLAQLLQSAEDVLTLLSQEGVYMDEIAVDEVDPDHWRRFFCGARGSSVEGANRVRDPHAIEQAGTLLRTDPIFRDAAMFFQQRFNQALSGIVPDAGDREILDISNTRSGRAFMLLSGVGGAFTD